LSNLSATDYLITESPNLFCGNYSRGFGRCYPCCSCPYPRMTQKEEAEVLNEEAEILEEELKAVKERLSSLKAEK